MEGSALGSRAEGLSLDTTLAYLREELLTGSRLQEDLVGAGIQEEFDLLGADKEPLPGDDVASGEGAVAQGVLLEAGLNEVDDPNVPQMRLQVRPASWTMRAWQFYSKAVTWFAALRGGHLNLATTMAAVIVGPNNCLLKILYIYYLKPDEDHADTHGSVSL